MLKDSIDYLKSTIQLSGISPDKGLGDDLFLFVSSLVPIINVDLLVYNHKGEILLSWRDDLYSGQGWHVPGGCVRFKETIHNRIMQVANKELGCNNLEYDDMPIKIFEFINSKSDITEREHFITLVIKCYVPLDYCIDNKGKKEGDPGYLRWFKKLPSDLLEIHSCYRDLCI